MCGQAVMEWAEVGTGDKRKVDYLQCTTMGHDLPLNDLFTFLRIDHEPEAGDQMSG